MFRIPTRLIRPHYQGRLLKPLQQTRGLSKIEVSNPWGLFFLRQSRSVLRAIVIFYGSALTLGVVGYYGSAYYIDKYQHMGKDWPIQAKLSGRLGVFYQDVRDDDDAAELALIFTLKSIAEAEGLKIDSVDNKKFSLLNLEQLEKKSKEWKATYVDVVARLALIKEQLGDVDNAWKLCHYAINLPMDLGSRELKSKLLRLAARIERTKGDFSKAEPFLLDAVRFNEYHESGVEFQELGSNLLSTSSHVTEELVNSLVDLGVTYSRLEEYTKSLEIFLNLLQIIDSHPELQTSSNRPMLKNYVGEILYKKGLTEKSIEWCRTAFKESYIYSKSDIKSAIVTKNALNNLVVLYRKTGDDELERQAQETLDNVTVPIKEISSTFLLEKMFR